MLKNVFIYLSLSIFLAGCSAEYSAVYQSVVAESKWDESGKILISDSKQALPLFRVIDNQLYLMIQQTEAEYFFKTVVNYPSWDKVEVSRLIQKHSDIALLIPADWNNWLPKGFGEECKPK